MHSTRRSLLAAALAAAVLATSSAPRGAAWAEDKKRDIATIENDLVADDPTVRAKAAAELADRFPDGAVAVPMLVDLLDDEAPEVVVAANSIDSIGVAAVAPIVRYCADDSRFAAKHPFASELLTEIHGTRRSCGVGPNRVDTAAWPETSSAATAALVRHPFMNAEAPLVELRATRATKGDAQTLWATALALQGLDRLAERDIAPTPSPERDDAVASASKLLSGGTDLRRWIGARLLGRLRPRDDAVIDALAGKLAAASTATPRSASERRIATAEVSRALEAIGPPAAAALPALIRLVELAPLDGPDFRTAVAAVVAMNKEAALEKIRGRDPADDADLAGALARGGCALPAVVTRLATDFRVDSSRLALTTLGPKAVAAMPAVRAAIRAKWTERDESGVDDLVRVALVIAPGDAETVEIVESVLAAPLSSTSQRERLLAAIACHAPVSASHAGRLLSAVTDPQDRELAGRLRNAELIAGLGRCGAAAAHAVPRIVQCLVAEDRYAQGDESLSAAVEIRRAMVLALGRIGPDAAVAISALTALRDHGDETIRVPAAQAIRRINAKK